MIPPVNSDFVKRCQLSAFACAIVTATIGVDFISTKSIAQSQTPSAICSSGTETVTYAPTLTNQLQTTTATISGSVSGCQNAEGITSGTYNFSVTAPISCNNIGLLPTYDITYTWSPTNLISLVQYTRTQSNQVGDQIILTSAGSVISGKFLNRVVIRTIALATTDVSACSTQGLSFITGPETLEILPATD